MGVHAACPLNLYTEWGKSRFTAVHSQKIQEWTVSCIHNCKPTSAPPCIVLWAPEAECMNPGTKGCMHVQPCLSTFPVAHWEDLGLLSHNSEICGLRGPASQKRSTSIRNSVAVLSNVILTPITSGALGQETKPVMESSHRPGRGNWSWRRAARLLLHRGMENLFGT